jgi:hypothetical protein
VGAIIAVLRNSQVFGVTWAIGLVTVEIFR